MLRLLTRQATRQAVVTVYTHHGDKCDEDKLNEKIKKLYGEKMVMKLL